MSSQMHGREFQNFLAGGLGRFPALRFRAGQAGQFRRVASNRFWIRLAVDELAFALATDQTGVTKDLQVVRDGRWGDAASRDQFAAADASALRDSLENLQAGTVGQRFGYFLDVDAIHVLFAV